MKAMRVIYARSLLLVLGFAALLLLEQIAPAPATVPAVAPAATVGGGHSPA